MLPCFSRHTCHRYPLLLHSLQSLRFVPDRSWHCLESPFCSGHHRKESPRLRTLLPITLHTYKVSHPIIAIEIVADSWKKFSNSSSLPDTGSRSVSMIVSMECKYQRASVAAILEVQPERMLKRDASRTSDWKLNEAMRRARAPRVGDVKSGLRLD